MSQCIIFIHSGYNDYLIYTLGITKHFNKNIRIILLGDDLNKTIANQLGIDFFHYADYNEDIPYYHVSVNGRQYEKFCFERWFIIHNFLLKHNLETFIHSDSDNAICYNASFVTFENACIGDYTHKYAIVPNIFFSNKHTLKKILCYYRALYTQDYSSFIRDITPYTSGIIHENPPVKLQCMHYSDMYFLLQTVIEMNLKFTVLPEQGELDLIYNGNYTNHQIIIENGEVIHGITKQKMFNIHFQGPSKIEALRFYLELTNHV